MNHTRVFILLSLAVLTGCKVGGPSPADQYRIEARDLRVQVEQLSAENAELKTKLAQLAAQRTPPVSSDAAFALPALAKLEIGDYSGLATDAPKDGTSIVRLYVRPIDSRGRVIQITGELDAAVTIEGQPTPLGKAHLTPTQLRDAYRAGFMGVYYVIEIPVSTASLAAAPMLQLSATFTDALSAAQTRADSVVTSTAQRTNK